MEIEDFSINLQQINKTMIKKRTTSKSTLQKDISDFEYLKVWQYNPNLDYYLSEQHWNFHVNQILYKNLLVFHDGKEVGAFLETPDGSFTRPIIDYTEKYGRMFNEAYRLCSIILTTPIPETKVAQFANQSATWKFRDLIEHDGKSINLIPNVIDLIESYHILGMVNAILTLANNQEESVDRFLIALSIYKDEGLPFRGLIHCFEPYNNAYEVFIITTMIDGTNLRPGYNYKTKDKYLRKNIPWYKNLAAELDKRMKETETIKQKDSAKTNMEKTMLGRISANNIRFYYEGWKNGKNGAISQTNGIYRFIEMSRGKSGTLDDINKNEIDNPVVAIGIVADWLMYARNKELVIKRMTKYKSGIPQNIRELFDQYTRVRFEQFRIQNHDNPGSWEWDWNKEFYTSFIISQEIFFNKMSEALFEYISDSDIIVVRSVMNNYIKYLKKRREEMGYHVSPELLVLRAINTQDKRRYEDLDDFEVNTILDKLEHKGYIKVAWIEDHRPESTRLLDKGRAYLKHLEEGICSVEASLADTPQPSSAESLLETSSQIPPSHTNSKHSQVIEDEEWDNQYDYIFNEKIKPREIKKAMESIELPRKISKVRFYYITYRVLEILNYIPDSSSRNDFLRWVNIHFNCGWIDDKQHKRRFSFQLENSSRNIEKQHPSEWDEKTIKGGSGILHHQLAVTLKNTFTQTLMNGSIVDNSDSFEHLVDRGQFLRFAIAIQDNKYYIPDDAYINNGK